jgi:hypothetical protein
MSGLVSRGSVIQGVPELAECGLRFAPSELISSGACDRLRVVGAALPPCFSVGAFECRLIDDERVDLLVYTSGEDGGRDACRSASGGAIGVAALLEHWANQSGVLGGKSAGIWLEFDLADALTPPFAFVRFGKGGTRGTTAQAVIEAMARLLAFPLPGGWREPVWRLDEALHDGERILHVATARHRGAPVRIHFGVAAQRLMHVLDHVGWTGNRRAANDSLLLWRDVTSPIGIQLDLDDRPRPGLDLEFYLPTTPSADERWNHLFRFLLDRGLAVAEKLRAASEWVEASEDESALWPLEVHRNLQMKLTVAADGQLSAKCYLGFNPRLWTP